MRTLGALIASIALTTAAAGKQADAPPSPGNASAGSAIVTGKGQCLSCHRSEGKGSRVGPELTDIGANRTPAHLETSLVDPAAEILPENRFYRVVTRDGTTITGRLLNHDTFQVLMLDAKEQLRTFMKTDLREHQFVEGSTMPSYRSSLSRQELADVIAYL